MNDHPLFIWRVDRLWLQSQAAKFVGCSQQDWSRYEQGTVLPRRNIYRRIVKQTGVSAGAIVDAYIQIKKK